MKLHLLPALLLAGSTLIAAPAFAQDFDSECSVDADCPMDYTCEEVGGYACASPPPCPEGDTECQMKRDSEPACESGVIMGCVAPPPEQCDPSAGAAACDAGLTCLTYTYEQCSGGDAPHVDGTCTVDPDGNESCEAPTPGEPESCTTESESYCVPDYFAPCQVDADCGGGFRCIDEPQDCYTVCSGGGNTGVLCPEGEECTEPEEPVGSCTEMCDAPSGEKYCELQQVECTSDSDCAGDLKCQEVEIYEAAPAPACAGGGSTDPVEPGGDDEGTGSGEDSEGTTEPDCPEPEPVTPTVENYCLPENWERWVGEGHSGGGVDYDSNVAESTGREEGQGGSSNGDWKLVDKQPAAPGATPEDDSSDDGETSGGCQSAQGSSPAGGLGLLAALGMMLGLRRRKS